ncbi:hypothetical protein SAMN05216382_0529 [Sphingomonas palmae]|uniref:Uncharacterized protein n=1 Tax=Sphingomonas palmae TaxID=1855283 RepID=A0A1H7HIV0_9SPHN|nr:hypothetical protein [Sphingomonas palmae]SEK50204.1 hypothetical protein SAMN05216382_0529 [Sphingomonas palmae]
MPVPVLSYADVGDYAVQVGAHPNVVARAHMRRGVTFVTFQQVPA